MADRARLQTPLGLLRIDAVIDGISALTLLPTTTYALGNEAYVIGWYQDTYDLELLISPQQTEMLSSALIAQCWGIIWRLKAVQPIQQSLFVVSWEPGYTWQEGGPDGQEGIYAKTWSNSGANVTFGTADEIVLEYRAQKGDGLPPHWEPYFGPDFFDHPSHYQFLNTGLPIDFPSLNPGEECQINFTIAWDHQFARESKLWRAMDISSGEFLAASGCT